MAGFVYIMLYAAWFHSVTGAIVHRLSLFKNFATLLPRKTGFRLKNVRPYIFACHGSWFIAMQVDHKSIYGSDASCASALSAFTMNDPLLSNCIHLGLCSWSLAFGRIPRPQHEFWLEARSSAHSPICNQTYSIAASWIGKLRLAGRWAVTARAAVGTPKPV